MRSRRCYLPVAASLRGLHPPPAAAALAGDPHDAAAPARLARETILNQTFAGGVAEGIRRWRRAILTGVTLPGYVESEPSPSLTSFPLRPPLSLLLHCSPPLLRMLPHPLPLSHSYSPTSSVC